MGYEAHLSDFLKVFGDPFSYVTVVKWTLENEKVFVVVKCNYVTVGLRPDPNQTQIPGHTCFAKIFPAFITDR